jgi:hypothetical protein
VDGKSNPSGVKTAEPKTTPPQPSSNEGAEYPEMEMGARAVDDGIDSTDDFNEVKKSLSGAATAVDPMAAKELELKSIETKEADLARIKQLKQDKNRQQQAKLYAVQEKKKRALDAEMQRKANSTARPYLVTDKDVEFKGIDE